MALVATLISDPRSPALSPSIANMASRAVGASGTAWLAEGIACDLALADGIAQDEAEKALRAAVADAPVDVAIQPAEGRRKKMLIADMDSTMIDQECIDELADEIGVKEHVADITARAMNGEIAFEPALRERVALLEGLELAVIERVITGRITLAAGGRELIATMRNAGAYTALVSGGFDLFTGRIAAELGFHEHRANRLIEKQGKLAGTVVEPILGRQAKADALLEIAARLKLDPSEVMAVGDGANDLGMLNLAGAGVAIHAKPSVAAQARIRIDHGDLTALLYVQGYRREEFAV
ncbi:phosphoserine phosphatase SerB [Chelativorans sp. AA-79]|uniref:phosphoserine phosphatase SerB n=1 Tax=Chelativorans sp. AA-79 TaxID=3028735 RepID=UPI0023FA2407|nr:phosphoserine phosphatase SerB [Chelativorans sp. AA-79]WEX11384.1 phosphoserine phosphatase SerB [Chelativorans sp. AA-79]